MPNSYSENAVISSAQRAGIAWNILIAAGIPGVLDAHSRFASSIRRSRSRSQQRSGAPATDRGATSTCLCSRTTST
jgi:hypothetical protein